MRMHIDITYFTNEVLGENCVNELVEYFSENDNDSIEDALEEYGDVYNAEEIRPARWRESKDTKRKSKRYLIKDIRNSKKK